MPAAITLNLSTITRLRRHPFLITTWSMMMLSSTSAPSSITTSLRMTELTIRAFLMIAPSEMRLFSISAFRILAAGPSYRAGWIGHCLLFRSKTGISPSMSMCAWKYAGIVPTSRQYPCSSNSFVPGTTFVAKS